MPGAAHEKHKLIINIMVEAAGPPISASRGRSLSALLMAATEYMKMYTVFSEVLPSGI